MPYALQTTCQYVHLFCKFRNNFPVVSTISQFLSPLLTLRSSNTVLNHCRRPPSFPSHSGSPIFDSPLSSHFHSHPRVVPSDSTSCECISTRANLSKTSFIDGNECRVILI